MLVQTTRGHTDFKFLNDGVATTRATVKDLISDSPITFTGGCTSEPSNFRTLLGAQAPVFSQATDNVVADNDTLTQPSIGAWGSLSNCTLEASTDEPWEGYSHSGKMTVTADGDATTTLDITAVTTNAAYTASAQVKGVAGRTYSIILTGDASGATTATAITATGNWQPIQLPKTFAADTTRTLTLTAISASAGDVVYWSAVQVESGSVATNFCLNSRTASSGSIANSLTAGQAFTAFFAVQKPSAMTTETIVDCMTSGNGWKLRGLGGWLSFEVSDGVAGKQQYLPVPTTNSFLTTVTRATDGTMNVRLAGSATASQACHALGSGDDQFNYPFGVCSDGTYIYVADTNNHRIVKRSASDLSYVAKIGTSGSGDDQFKNPYSVCSDGMYIYVADVYNHRIVKRLASDLSYVAEIGSAGTGNDQFNLPIGVCSDGTHIYVADYFNHRIVKRLASDLSYVSKIGTQGSGNDQFSNPSGVCSDGTHIYVADYYNNRIVKCLASDLSFVAKIGTLGSGNDQFRYPRGVCSDGTHIYVADHGNHRIVKRLASDLSYVSKIGTAGSGNDQFNLPYGVATDGTYVYVVDSYNHRIVKRTPLLAFEAFSPLGNGLETAVGALGLKAVGGAILCAVIGRVLTGTEIAEIESAWSAGTLSWGDLLTTASQRYIYISGFSAGNAVRIYSAGSVVGSGVLGAGATQVNYTTAPYTLANGCDLGIKIFSDNTYTTVIDEWPKNGSTNTGVHPGAVFQYAPDETGGKAWGIPFDVRKLASKKGLVTQRRKDT